MENVWNGKMGRSVWPQKLFNKRFEQILKQAPPNKVVISQTPLPLTYQNVQIINLFLNQCRKCEMSIIRFKKEEGKEMISWKNLYQSITQITRHRERTSWGHRHNLAVSSFVFTCLCPRRNLCYSNIFVSYLLHFKFIDKRIQLCIPFFGVFFRFLWRKNGDFPSSWKPINPQAVKHWINALCRIGIWVYKNW